MQGWLIKTEARLSQRIWSFLHATWGSGTNLIHWSVVEIFSTRRVSDFVLMCNKQMKKFHCTVFSKLQTHIRSECEYEEWENFISIDG